MRALGVGILGLFCGLLAGFMVTEIVAVSVMGPGGQLPESLPLMIVLGWISPVMAVVGVVVALLIDGRIRSRNGSEK
ncbi:MAG: hypothetical protein ACRDUA_18390 [Micromonosporaceae bacterium]